MSVKLSDINIAYDTALEQERMDFFQYEEERDKLEREAFGVCECYNGTGQYMDYVPHSSRYTPCDNCNGTGFLKEDSSIYPKYNDTKLVESNIPMVGNEECYYCED